MLMGEYKQSTLYKWQHCFPNKLEGGTADVNPGHMSHSNSEVTAFLCGGMSLCVYDCFDVHHKFLLKGHQIVTTHQKSGCNNMLMIHKNCSGNWRIITSRPAYVPSKYRKQTFKTL